jgi:Ribbon-helix-helix domain
MAAVNNKQVACFLRTSQHDDLKRLSAETLIPMQTILRQAVDKILADYKIRPKKYRAEYISARLAGLKTGRTKK